MMVKHAWSNRQAILARVATELGDHQRGCYGSLLNNEYADNRKQKTASYQQGHFPLRGKSPHRANMEAVFLTFIF